MLQIDKPGMALRTLIIGVVVMCCMISCKDDATFAAEHKLIIDTTFLSQKRIMQMEIDSLCLTNNEDYYEALYDSIMDTRIAEIESLLQAAESKRQRR